MIHNGWSEETALTMADNLRAAFCIMHSEFNGAKFNLDRWDFEDPEP